MAYYRAIPQAAMRTAEEDRYYQENKDRFPNPDAVLGRIFSMVSFPELCRLRGVCRYWDEYVKGLPRYWNNLNMVLDSKWVKTRCPSYQIGTTTQWKNLTFNQYVFKFNTFSRIHWEQVKLSLSTVVFKDVKLQCDRLASTINDLRNIQSVSLINVHFPSPEYFREQYDAAHLPPHLQPQLFCTHRDLATLPRLRPQPGRITKIVSHGNPLIPNCVMLLLAHRSAGTLREFEFTNSVRPDPDRVQPPAELVETSLVRILLAPTGPNNQPRSILEKLTIQDITSEMTILSNLAQRIPGLALQEISLAQRNGDNFVQTGRILEFLDWQQPKLALRKVDLMVQNTWNVDTLMVCILGMAGLEKLRLHFGPRTEGNVNLNALQHLHTLTDLEVSSAPKVAEIINPAYLGLLRDTLRKLTVGHHGITEPDLVRLLESPAMTNLKELHILKGAGAGVTNDVMARIIRTLPLLEKLSVNESPHLTDRGFLGCSQASIDFLLKSSCYASMIHSKEPPGVITTNIKELTRLRSLNLRSCTKISDVSVILGFKLPHLREIDISYSRVTNLGLLWLANNNPGLETLICEYNNNISRFGLNQLITAYPSIKNIKTNAVLMDKYVGNIHFQNCSRYATVVTKKPRSDN